MLHRCLPLLLVACVVGRRDPPEDEKDPPLPGRGSEAALDSADTAEEDPTVDADFGPCVTIDLGDAVGRALAAGDNYSLSDDHRACTGSTGGPDLALGWVAPADGYYTITTEGSSYDTVLDVVLEDCEGENVGCNDDSGGGLWSSVTLSVIRNQPYVIYLDSYSSGSLGAWQLNIAEGTGGGGSPF